MQPELYALGMKVVTSVTAQPSYCTCRSVSTLDIEVLHADCAKLLRLKVQMVKL